MLVQGYCEDSEIRLPDKNIDEYRPQAFTVASLCGCVRDGHLSGPLIRAATAYVQLDATGESLASPASDCPYLGPVLRRRASVPLNRRVRVRRKACTSLDGLSSAVIFAGPVRFIAVMNADGFSVIVSAYAFGRAARCESGDRGSVRGLNRREPITLRR
jgi:hypothetical protein